MQLIVRDKYYQTDDLVSVVLSRTDGGRLPDWTPGAHIDVFLPNGLARQYSLCGDPWNTDNYHIGVLGALESRGGSRFIHDELKIGSVVGLGGPRNNFALTPSKTLLFVAGGVGITPILPMINQAEQMGISWRLLYLGRNLASMAFRDRVERFSDRVTLHPGDELGRMAVSDWIGAPRDGTKIYVCGPERLLTTVTEHCADWQMGTVRAERFTARKFDAPLRSGSFEILMAGSGKVIRVLPTESMVAALRSAGVNTLTSCGMGICGTCEMSVLSGVPDHRDSILDEDERLAGNCMFPCVSRSLTDRLVLGL
ncbi:oxidoreductase [Cryobacterium melibiosiphilum]|uniref:Oxidoreductase n=2 Tax=Cryobacterium melibiosiphilum TaxID=995039 RepID=A0A3A5MHN2_9MICO|nr:oxidoreductase [Cryobacterium melibiosiphilum]